MSVLNMCFTRTEHGVADFEAWLKSYKEHDAKGFHKQIGISDSIVELLEEKTEGKARVCITHYYKPERKAKVRGALDFTKEPLSSFVKSGAVFAIKQSHGTVVH